MNPILDRLQPYPFERLRRLLAGVEASPVHRPLNLSIGEPRHQTPALILAVVITVITVAANVWRGRRFEL